MILKEFIMAKCNEINKKADELSQKYKNISSVEAVRDFSKVNGKYELINEIMNFIILEEYDDRKGNCQAQSKS